MYSKDNLENIAEGLILLSKMTKPQYSDNRTFNKYITLLVFPFLNGLYMFYIPQFTFIQLSFLVFVEMLVNLSFLYGTFNKMFSQKQKKEKINLFCILMILNIISTIIIFLQIKLSILKIILLIIMKIIISLACFYEEFFLIY